MNMGGNEADAFLDLPIHLRFLKSKEKAENMEGGKATTVLRGLKHILAQNILRAEMSFNWLVLVEL